MFGRGKNMLDKKRLRVLHKRALHQNLIYFRKAMHVGKVEPSNTLE
jgi:hypothetical protein